MKQTEFVVEGIVIPKVDPEYDVPYLKLSLPGQPQYQCPDVMNLIFDHFGFWKRQEEPTHLRIVVELLP